MPEINGNGGGNDDGSNDNESRFLLVTETLLLAKMHLGKYTEQFSNEQTLF